MTTERKETSSRAKASRSTKPKTIGALRFSSAFWSAELAVGPVTAYWAPFTLPIVAGRISLRSLRNAAFDLASVPFPTSGMSTRATVCAGLTCSSIEPELTPSAIVLAFNAAIAF